MFTLRYRGGAAVLTRSGADWTCDHATTARAFAKATAAMLDQPITVMRGARVAYVMQPDGTARPPEGAIEPERTNCAKGSGQACFCIPCREERRATPR